MGVLELLLNIVPVVNVVTDLVQGIGASEMVEGPSWWGFGIKLYTTVLFLQIMTPYLEKLTRSTANTWDDSIIAKLKMVIAFVLELAAAAGAIDPKFGARLRSISGPRE